MWISKADYTRLLKADASQTATIEWLRVRVNQLEQERAELVAKVTGIQPVVPSIQKAPVLDPANPEAMFPTLRALFEDVGDDAADRLGIRHDDVGTVLYDH